MRPPSCGPESANLLRKDRPGAGRQGVEAAVGGRVRASRGPPGDRHPSDMYSSDLWEEGWLASGQDIGVRPEWFLAIATSSFGANAKAQPGSALDSQGITLAPEQGGVK